MTTSWSEGSEDDDLVRELLDDGSPLLIEPPNTTTKASSSDDQDQAFNKFISNIYSGPTISDIENALSVTNQRDHFPQLSSARYKMLPNLAKLLFMAFKKKINYSLWVSLWLYVAWVSWIEHPFGACLMFLFHFHFRVSILERGLSKIENKYTLKIKCFGNVMGDDGYKWRKYGQKSIKNSPNPR